jgi:hypothetical protein
VTDASAKAAKRTGSSVISTLQSGSQQAEWRRAEVAAYDELRAVGYVDSRQGSGTRVTRTPGGRRLPDGRVPGGAATSIFQRLRRPPDVCVETGATGGRASGSGAAGAVLAAQGKPP